jgi:hypothetical protein
MAGPCGSPRNVEGATSTSGLRPMRLTIHAASKERVNARSPSTAMLTGVPTGVPSWRKLVSNTVRCVTKGSSICRTWVVVDMELTSGRRGPSVEGTTAPGGV